MDSKQKLEDALKKVDTVDEETQRRIVGGRVSVGGGDKVKTGSAVFATKKGVPTGILAGLTGPVTKM